MPNLYCSTKLEYRSRSNTYSRMQFKHLSEHLQVYTNAFFFFAVHISLWIIVEKEL